MLLLDDLDWIVAPPDDDYRRRYVALRRSYYVVYENCDGTYDFCTGRRDLPDWEDLDKLTAQCVLNHLLDSIAKVT
jgi:hypothetical protein